MVEKILGITRYCILFQQHKILYVIVQILYNKIDKELISIIRIISNIKAKKEIIFSKSEKNKVLINSYKVWEKGEDVRNIIEQFYDIKIYELVRGAMLGVSS